ncbi:hypothetical protein L218DRAFT_1004104 [Marasmius fiardii PR-910]|nr:hypothetical protein L218DRAFT_1004104 [Marasmius fiardii PR-910]
MSSHSNQLHASVPALWGSHRFPSAREGVYRNIHRDYWGRIRVPQSEYEPKSRRRADEGRSVPLKEPIDFNLRGSPTPGIPLVVLSPRPSEEIELVMEGGGDHVLQDVQEQKIVFRVLWPGYGHVDTRTPISILTRAGLPMTRAQLGKRIAQRIASFIERCQNEETSDSYWQIHHFEGIKIDQPIIVSLVNVFRNAWQAEIVLVGT